MAEGKRTLNGREFDICKGQGITLQRFADLVYLFFPRHSWLRLNNEERNECVNQCDDLGLGLLIVDINNNVCKELCPPSTNKALLKKPNKEKAIKAMVELFPDFSMDLHTEYCKKSQLGNSMLIEGLELLNKLSPTKVYPYNDNGIFTLQTSYRQIKTGEWIMADYIPFGIGMTFTEEETEKEDDLNCFSFKPTLALTLKIEGNGFSFGPCKSVLEKFLNTSVHSVIISVDTENTQLAGMKLADVIHDLETDNDSDLKEKDFGNIESILLLIDIPIFAKDIQHIRKDIDNACSALENLATKIQQYN